MAVTAWPTILIDSATGSDTQASGAGPGTALFGTTDASTDGAGTTVTLTAGTDLTGVATDGSHVIYLADTTAGHRRFAAINAKAGSGGATPTVVVEQAFTINLTTKSWAIGGKRAALGSASSSLLYDNNTASGDAMPGWIMEFQSGHTETIAANANPRRAGDTTTGPIIIRGKAAAATRPVITFSNNGPGWTIRAAYWQFRAFEMQNSNATKTASIAFTTAGTNPLVIEDIKCKDSTNKFWKFYVDSVPAGGYKIVSCEIGNTANSAIHLSGGGTCGGVEIINNWIYNSGAAAILLAANNYFGAVIRGNIVYNTTGVGISYDNSRNDPAGSAIIEENTIDLSSSDGIQIVTASVQSITSLDIINNILSNNGQYGLNFAAAGHTDAQIAAYAPFIKGNNTYNNTSGAYHSNTGTYTNTTCPWASGDLGLNPTYTAASTGDYSITNAALKSQGYPLGGTQRIGTGSTTYSYVTPGAAQPLPTQTPALILQSTGTY